MKRQAGFTLPLSVILVLVGLLHLNTLRRPHVEGDEIIFTFLSEKVRTDLLAYTPRGGLDGDSARRFVHEVWEPKTGREFPPDTRPSLLLAPPDQNGFQANAFDFDLYDVPMFTHPPLFVYALAAVRAVFGTIGGLLFPVACHLATIALLALLGRMIAGETVGIAAAAVMAVEAVSWVSAERVWIDSLLQLLVTASVLSAYWSLRVGGSWRFALAGAMLALAGLSKLAAGLVVPAIALVWYQQQRRLTAREWLAFCLPPVVLIGGWLMLTRVVLGQFFPVGWPTAWMIDNLPWIKHMVERSPLVYVVGFLLVSPALAYAAVAGWRTHPLVPVLVVWSGAFWLGMSVLGAMGMGFQLRHLAAGIPALCLLAGLGIMRCSLPWRMLAIALGVYSLVVGLNSALSIEVVDPFWEPLWRYVAEIFGWDLRHIPGSW
jgi:4-amino-4-deoxy-L-arabinose transferase-like glycosyltransferase